MLSIKHITKKDADLDAAVQLFKDYAAELNVNLCFQSFDAELEDPLKKYGSPNGALFLGYFNNEPVACIALQPIADGSCEMKRLYVKPAFRKFKIGDTLVQQLLITAKKLGYKKMKLDTLQRLQPAINLYKKHGFIVTTAYYKNPLPEVVFMEKDL
ncbi:MAG: GNAT family N-acetyltransferase, partial [Pedobacter sp.]|nr:GNAT family N-acetyltransferase [Chitinophagaceae bacterium]